MKNPFLYGKAIETGKEEYLNGSFEKAVILFEKAHHQKPTDFEGTFWLARALLKAGNKEYGLEKLNSCLSLRPDLHDRLLVHWAYAASGEQYPMELDKKTNQTLQDLHLEKRIRFKDVGLYFLIILLLGFIWAIIRKAFSIEISINHHISSVNLTLILVLAYRLYSRTVVKDNAVGFFNERKHILKSIMLGPYKNILYGQLGIDMLFIMVAPRKLIEEYSSSEFHWSTFITPGVGDLGIIFAVMFSIGFIFNILHRYHRALAFYLSTILFVILFWPLASLLNSIRFFALLIFYEKYKSLSVVLALLIIEIIIIATIFNIRIFFRT